MAESRYLLDSKGDRGVAACPIYRNAVTMGMNSEVLLTRQPPRRRAASPQSSPPWAMTTAVQNGRLATFAHLSSHVHCGKFTCRTRLFYIFANSYRKMIK